MPYGIKQNQGNAIDPGPYRQMKWLLTVLGFLDPSSAKRKKERKEQEKERKILIKRANTHGVLTTFETLV